MAMRTTALYDVVVVHYDNDEVYGVLDAVAQQTAAPRRVVLVDNSGTVDAARLTSTAPDVRLIRSPNDGYAAAVNLGVRELEDGAAPYLVVLTHEVRMTDETLPTLIAALEHDATLGSVGPVLRYRSATERVFSLGGRMDRFGRPSHITTGADSTSDPVSVAWIDGSVMALRRTALDAVGRIDERYFLYFEEIDLAARLIAAGWVVAVVQEARAWQEPGGYPPYLAVRNRLLLLRENPRLLTAPRALLLPRLLLEIAWTAYRRGVRTVPASLHGLVDGFRGITGAPRP